MKGTAIRSSSKPTAKSKRGPPKNTDESARPKAKAKPAAPAKSASIHKLDILPEKRISATIEAAKILISNLSKILGGRNFGLIDIQKAIIPIFGIEWTREVVIGVTTNSINNIPKRIKNSPAGPSSYLRLEKLWLDSFVNPSTPFPLDWMQWRNLLVKFGLFRTRPASVWAFIVRDLADRGINQIHELAELRRDQLPSLELREDSSLPLYELWQVARIAFAKREGFGINSNTDFRINNSSLIRTIKGKDINDSAPARRVRRLGNEIALPANYLTLGPAARIRALAASGAPLEKLTEYTVAGCQLNVLRQVGRSLPSVRSGIQCYLSFCSLLQLPSFPPTERGILQWSSIFKPGATFGLYTQHVLKACQLVGADVDWLTASVRSIARGLKRARDLSFRFHNFASLDIIKEVLAIEGWNSDFLQAIVISFLFSLRVPSETLMLVRAFGDDPILEFTKQKPKALIGVREMRGAQLLVIKFRFRKNLPGGCILRRPCICTPKRPVQLMCPIHVIWEHIRLAVRPGDPIFPKLSARNFNPTLKRVFSRAKIPDAGRFSSHCFRRGATQAIKNGSSSATVLAGSGAWNSRAVLGYVDLTQDESAEISAALLDPSLSSDSEDDLLSAKQIVRKRILRLPHLSQSLRETPDSDPDEDDDLTSEESS